MLNKHFVILGTLLLAVLYYVNFLNTVHPVPLLRSLAEFPESIGAFTKVSSQKFDPKIEATAGMDNYLMNRYRNKEGADIWLYIGYYEQQTEGSIIHSPKHCLPGGGWQFQRSGVQKIMGVDGEYFSVNRALLRKNDTKQFVYYWYQGRGRVVTNEYLDRALLIVDSILRKRSDGALIRITGDGLQLENHENQQIDFIKELLPILNTFIPR